MINVKIFLEYSWLIEYTFVVGCLHYLVFVCIIPFGFERNKKGANHG